MVQLPFNINLATNVAKIFLSLIDKHFPKNNKLSEIFIKNTIKVSYSCLPNVKQTISRNNKRLLQIHRNKESPQNDKYYYGTAGKKTPAHSTGSASPNVLSAKQRGQNLIPTIKKLTSGSQKTNSRLGAIYPSHLLSWNIKEPQQHLVTTFGN